MKLRIREIASVVRSKNAGPFELTFDIILRNESDYRRIRDARALTPELFASLYGVSTDQILDIIHFDPARAVKITMKRPRASGDPGETDVYGAQQHAPLLDLCLDV